MPVITPAFPAMCATHSITPSTKRIMMEEFLRADGIVRDVFAGKKTWAALFDRTSFFTSDHKNYLSVVAASRSKEDNLTFNGLVKSKVRLLVQGIDEGQTGIELARPFTEGFERVHRCKNEDQITEVSKNSINYMIPEAKVPDAIAAGDHLVYTTTFYIGIRLPEGTCPFAILARICTYTSSRESETRHILSDEPVQIQGYRIRSIQ